MRKVENFLLLDRTKMWILVTAFCFVVFIVNPCVRCSELVDTSSVDRCNLICQNREVFDKRKCLTGCLKNYTKPGKCPNEMATVSELEKVCINACRSDTDCPATLKCCHHPCGITCMTPTQMNLVTGLPSMPTNITIQVDKSDIRGKGLPIVVRWDTANNSKLTTYGVEERHSYDKEDFDESSDKWISKKQTNNNNITIKNLNPKFWYQFRVRVTNENGTIGPSPPSQPFKLLLDDLTPEAPTDFGIIGKSWGNGTLRLLLSWSEPISPLPVVKYKLTWSRRKNDTLMQYHHNLPSNVNHFWLHGIEPKIQYFLELHAVAKLDKRKIPGKSSGIVFTAPEDKGPKQQRKIKPSELNLQYKKDIENVKVNSLFSFQERFFANVSWEPIDSSQISYSVRWFPDTCCDKCRGWYVARTEIPNFVIYDLLPECDYKITVKATLGDTFYLGSTTLPPVNCNRETSSPPGVSDEVIDCPLSR